MSSPLFNTGMAHMQTAIDEGKKRAAQAQSGGGGKALHYFNWKPGDKKILRFLTDDVMTEEFAEFILDKTGNTKNFMIPPSDPNILNRYRSPSPGIGWRKNPKTGALEDPKTRKVGIGIAVLRTESVVDGKLQVQDYLYDQAVKDDNGNEAHYLSRHFGIVQQSVSNFWHTLAVSCFKRYGTICDRDYLIERSGAGLDTKYDILPLDPDPDLATVEAVQNFYFYGQQWDEADGDRFLKCPQTLVQWAQYFSNEDRFKRWLVPDTQTPVQSPLGASLQGQYVVGQTPNPHPQTMQSPSQSTATPHYPQQPQQAQPANAWSGDNSDPMGEFHPETTHNPPEVAAQTTGTGFSTFKEALLDKAKHQANRQ